MADEKKNIFKRLIKERFRITFFHDDFKPVFSLRFTWFTFILANIGFAFLLISLTALIIAKTNLKEYIPGYPSQKENKDLIQLYIRVDSLQSEIYKKDIYLNSILNAINGKQDTTLKKQQQKNNYNQVNVQSGTLENELKKEYEQEQIKNSSIQNNDPLMNLNFLPPANGVPISKFDPAKGHYGIDISIKNQEPIKAIDKGIIISCGYSITDGNYVIIAHSNSLISMYKHLFSINKQMGTFVKAGEIIGLGGNTGTESNGYHLHLEIWYKTEPLNPASYILY